MNITIMLLTLFALLVISWFVIRYISVTFLSERGGFRSLFQSRKQDKTSVFDSEPDKYLEDVQLGPVLQANSEALEDTLVEYSQNEQHDEFHHEQYHDEGYQYPEDIQESSEELVLNSEFAEDRSSQELEEFEDSEWQSEQHSMSENSEEEYEEVLEVPSTLKKKSSRLARIHGITDIFDFRKDSESAKATTANKNHSPLLRPIQVAGEDVKLPDPAVNQLGFASAAPDISQFEETEQEEEFEIETDFPDYFDFVDPYYDVIGWLPESDLPINSSRVIDAFERVIKNFLASNVRMQTPLIFMGFDVVHGVWLDLKSEAINAKITDIVLAIPMYYKGDAVSEREWWLFSTLVGDLASALNREHKLSQTTNTIFEESRQLAAKFKELDLQIVLLLQSQHPGYISDRSMEYIAREFKLQMWQNLPVYDYKHTVNGKEHILFQVIHITDASKELINNLKLETDFQSIVIFGNFSCCVDPGQAFEKMIEFALGIGDRLSLKLVDLNQQELSFDSIRYIRTVIDDVIEELIEYGLEPGSESAIRLFENTAVLQELIESKN